MGADRCPPHPRHDAVLFDLVIPGGPDAVEALRRLRELGPHVPVIACSGYADSSLMARFAEHGFAAVLGKPFTVAELRAALDVALRAEAEAEAETETR